MIIQLPTWQQVRRSPQVRQLLQILQLLLNNILMFLDRLHVPQYAGAAGEYTMVHLRRLGNALYEEIPPLPEFPPEYRELLLLPQKLAELPQHIPDYMFPSYWKAVYDDLPPLPPYVYPSWWKELYNGLPGWLFPSYYRNLALDAILKIWSVYIGFLASRDTSKDLEDSPQELYETLSQTRDAVVELLQEDVLPSQPVSQKPQTEVLIEEVEEEPEQQEEEEGVWGVEIGKGGKGLSRYPGVENLLEQSDGIAPTAVPIQTLPRHSMVLSSIPDTPEQPKPQLPPVEEPEKPDISTTEDEFEDVSESSGRDKDGIWASLVSKYAQPEKPKKEKSRELDEEFIDDGPEYVGTADEIVERYTAKSAVSLDLDEDEDDGRPMTDDDFTKVGRRLEEYLSRLDEDEATSKASKVKSDKAKKTGVQVVKESKAISLQKEKQPEIAQSLEDETEREPTMEDIEAELRRLESEREPTMEDIVAELQRLEEMEAEIALMEQGQKEISQSNDAEAITASEAAGMSEVEKSEDKIETVEFAETHESVQSETIVKSEIEENLMSKKPEESLITECVEEIIKPEVYKFICGSSEKIDENLESVQPEEEIVSEISKEIIESEKSNEKLESEPSDDILDLISKDIIASEKPQETFETKTSEDKFETKVSELIKSEKSEEKIESQSSEDILESEISEEVLSESEKSDEKLESEESTEYTETTESESEPITELPVEKITIEMSASVTDSGSIKGFFTNLWNRADNQQMVEKSFEKTLTSESKQTLQNEDVNADITTGESEPKSEEISSSEVSTDPASIKDFFQSLWTRADNTMTLEKTKDIETPLKDEVERETEIITEEKLVDEKESKALLETDIDEVEEESEVSVEVIVKPEDKPAPKSILKKPSFDMSPSAQEKTFEMRVEELKAEIGEKTVAKSPPEPSEEKTFEMKVKELKADMMDKASYKKPFMEELEQEKTFEMKIEALKSEMKEVEIEVKDTADESLRESENMSDFNGVSYVESLETKLDEAVQEKIIEKESEVLTDLIQSNHLEEKSKKDEITAENKISDLESEILSTDVSVECKESKTVVSIETEHDKEELTAISETENTGISVVEATHSTVPQLDVDIHTMVSEKVDSDIKAEIAIAMEEKEGSEIKIESVNGKSHTSDKDNVEIKDELKQSIKEADDSNSSNVKGKRPPVGAWRGWSQATLDDVGDLEMEGDLDENLQDLSKRKGSTISESGSVKGFFENLWKCAEVEGIKHKSIDSKSRSESMDAGSLLESSNGKKETDISVDMPEKQTDISQSEKLSDIDLVSEVATPEEVTAAAVMTEFWGRRIEESDDEDMLIKQTVPAEDMTPVSDFWNRKILEDSSAEKETSAPAEDFWGHVDNKTNNAEEIVTNVTDNRNILEDSSVEKESTVPAEGIWGTIDKNNKADEVLKVTDSRNILEESIVEKEPLVSTDNFWGTIDDKSNKAEEIVTNVTDNRMLSEDSVEKETSVADEGFWYTIDKKNNKDDQVINNVTEYKHISEDSSVDKEPSVPAEGFWGTINNKNKADEVLTKVTDSRNILEDSSIEKEPSVPTDDFWGNIDNKNNKSDKITIVTDFWGSETENLKSSKEDSSLQGELTNNEEVELKDYLYLKDECETDTGSLDIGSIKSLDKTIGKYSPMTISLEKDDHIPKHLEEVEDLLMPARPPRRSKKSSPVDVDDDIDIPETDRYMRKYMEMPANLTEDEEMELREYMDQHKDESEELSLERYLEMNPDLTEEEKIDYEELLIERQSMRERERKELSKYLDMPVGLTEEEKRELEMMEKEEGDEGEEWDEARNFRELLDMPADLTEEEMRILQEDEDDEEMEFEDEDAYRQYIKHKFLMQLDEDAYAGYETEYEGEGGYGYETEYEGDAEYDEDYEEEMEGEYIMVHEEEEDTAVVEQPKTSIVDGSVNTDSVLKKTKRMFGFKKSSNENSVEGSPALGKKFGFKKGSSEEKSKEESPSTSKKKVGFSKLASKDTSDEGSPASAKKKFGFPKLVTKESNEAGSPATQKKFFRFGSLGTKKKKGASDENLDKPGGSNSFTVGFCTIERDMNEVKEHFSDFYSIDDLKKKSLDNTTGYKTKNITDTDLNTALCKSLRDILSNQISKENEKSKQKIDSSLLSTSRIKPECEIPEVFLYSPPADDLKYEREIISPGEEDMDFWHQWQSEELSTVRISSEWVDDLDVIEEEPEFGGDLDVIYEESEEEYNFEDKSLRHIDSEEYDLKEEIKAVSVKSLVENFNNVQDNQEHKPLDNTNEHNQYQSNDLVKSFIDYHEEEILSKTNEGSETNHYKDKCINRENSEDEIDKGLERISEEIYELTEEKENLDWWGQINNLESSSPNVGALMNDSEKKITETTQNSNKSSDTVVDGAGVNISDKINEIETESKIETDNKCIESLENSVISYENNENNTEVKVNNLWEVITSENSSVCNNDNINVKNSEENAFDDEFSFGDIAGSEDLLNMIEDISLIKNISSIPVIEVQDILESNIDKTHIKQSSILVIPRIEITEPEENDAYAEKVNENKFTHNNTNSLLIRCEEIGKANNSTKCEKSSPMKCEEKCKDIEDISTVKTGASKEDSDTVKTGTLQEDSDSEESEPIGYIPLDEESSDSLPYDVNVNNLVEKFEKKSVICKERTDSQGENAPPAVKNRTVKEEEDLLQCLDNEIGTLIDKIKYVHKVNIDASELVLSKNIVNKSLVSDLEVKSSTLGNCISEVGNSRDIESVVECVEKFSVTSPRTNYSNSRSSISDSSSRSQHIPQSGDTILLGTVIGSAMADVDDSSETRMEIDEGVEDAEEVEVQENAADKEDEDDEGEDIMADYVKKQDKLDDEALTFNKDDDDDDELPDFEKKPKKKSSKSSKENGVDDEKKKKKRRKAPDGKKKRVSRTTGEEKENKKATYQKDDILAKHVGPRVRSFDANKIQKKFDKPKYDASDDIDDILAKKMRPSKGARTFEGPHVRSFDSNKIKKQFNRPKPASTQLSNDCKMCGKQVYQMEKIVAEKASWHKNCFRCKECNKNLTLETYQSHEGNLYCKPHFKELFQPKAVVEDENEARKERSTDKPDYGLEELSSANVKQKFSMFENKGKEKDDRSLESPHVRRSQSLMNKAARFLKGDDGDSEGEYGVDNSYLGEYDEEDEDEDEEDEEEEEDEYEEVEVEVTDEDAEEDEEEEKEEIKVNGKVNGTKENGLNDEEDEEDEEKEDEEKEDEEKDEEEREDDDDIKENGFKEEEPQPKKKIKKIIKVKKEKPKKEKKEKKTRKERPGKNTNLKEMFESGKIDNYDSDDERSKRKEQIKIERAQQARSIKDRFEKGEAFGGENSDEERNYTDERRECEEIFREAETARAARKRFNQIDSKVKGEGRDIMRSQSFANAPITNRRLSNEGQEPAEETDFGRDPNYIKSTDKFDDNIDCARTKKLLDMFKKMEMQNSDEDERGPPPPRRFTPPPEGEEFDSEEYSDEEYTDDDDDDEDDYTDDEEEEEEEDENGVRVPKYKDEVLEMKATQDKSPKQSARKAASLRAKFEKWENDVDRKNELNRGSDEGEESEGGTGRPSIDSARNLRKMFENKATEQPVLVNKPKHKVNRFVGGGGEKCVICSKTVYALERLEVVGKVLHKKCFKCAKCKSTLGMGNFSVGGDSYYCTTHYKQMFAEKGTYDVFTPNKGKWTRKIEASNGEAPKSQE